MAVGCYLKHWKEKETIVKKTIIFLVTIGLLLSIFEITTVSANMPAAQLDDSIGSQGLLDLPGVEVSEKLVRTYNDSETGKGLKTRSAAASTLKDNKTADAGDTHIKETILCLSLDRNTDAQAPKFIHGEGIPQPLPEKYSEEEKEMIAYVVYAEARGECFEGMVAVAQVIINRYESGKFGESVKSVVYSRHQFAVSRRYNDICMKAVEYAIDYTPYPKNMYYFQKSKRKEWYGIYFDRIGNHSFFCGKW